MRFCCWKSAAALTTFACLTFAAAMSLATMKIEAAPQPGPEDFAAVKAKMEKAKAGIAATHNKLLEERYDLANKPGDAKMSRGKPVQAGARCKLPNGLSWEQLAKMSPEEIKEKDLFPAGFYPLPHPHH
ncbi:MAG TPA: hypothetical protein VE988_20860, partial [Gemmataceae bacterium]|nr:hypothetical protein [Gemmataceae bacterium]